MFKNDPVLLVDRTVFQPVDSCVRNRLYYSFKLLVWTTRSLKRLTNRNRRQTRCSQQSVTFMNPIVTRKTNSREAQTAATRKS